MTTNNNKPLAKVFLPALLLTAALSLPVESMAAPSPNPRNAQSDKADKNEKKQKKAVRQDRREINQDRKKVQQVSEANRRKAAERQRQLAQQRAAAAAKIQKQRKADHDRQVRLQREARLNRQAQLNRQAEINRRAQLQRQAEINRRAQFQRQAELNRRAELQRQADLRRRAEQQRYRNNNNGRYVANRGRYNFGDSIAVDGHLTNEGYQCQALRDDDGTLYMLVGNTYGLRTGDHARLVGRVVDGGHCDWEGTAFEVTDVRALWADRRHRSVYYHENYDGGRFGHRNNWTGRRARAFENRVEQRHGYYDRDENRYADRYRD